MKITKIEAYPVKLKLKEPFVIANVTNDDMFYVIVRLETDNGIFGYGEAIPAWEVTGETQFSVIDVINHFCEPQKSGITLIGQDISTFSKVAKLIEKISPKSGINKIWGAPSAKAAIEQAVLDAYGKHVGKPIYKLFNGKNQNIEFNKSISVYSVEETLRRIQKELKQGVKVIKLKIGIENAGGLAQFERDIQVIKHARKLIDEKYPSCRLVADANQGFVTPENTIRFIKQVDGCLDWLEQPILADDKLGFKKIKEACNVKLMADESVHNYHDAKLMIELGAVDYINLKIMKTGGIFEARRIADLAEKHGVPCQMGSMIENQIGTAICAHTFLSHENIKTAELSSYSRLREHIGSGIKLGNNYIRIPDLPGNGIEVNDQDIFKHIIGDEDSLTLKSIKNQFGIKEK
jgi:L-alanine-DL-glutamate epimerase-like enolase superfamily enzyme